MKMAKRVYVSKNGNTSTATADATELVFTFTNGKALSVKFDALPANVLDTALRHGISQKVGDSFAGAMTADEAVESAKATIAALTAGNWSAPRESTGGVLAEAVAKVRKIPVEQAAAALAKLDDEQLKAVRAHREVRAAVATIAAARAVARAKDAPSEPLPF